MPKGRGYADNFHAPISDVEVTFSAAEADGYRVDVEKVKTRHDNGWPKTAKVLSSKWFANAQEAKSFAKRLSR